ncbi:unnamed protein product [Moneuplotes crassus]|uniref:Uncharacterized protein n=1 Tax=Euplotes crassus TaxID=5936 RepID=A0AAD1XNI5_EUPCR|nr:unnamed protein product [Moneuplotes crassus]
MENNTPVTETSELEFLKEGSQVLLLRHANSKYNFAYETMTSKGYTEEDEKKLRVKKDLRDSPLSDLGIQQCIKAQPLANKLKVDHVFVSPLKRALETAYYVFMNHPNFDNIQFILMPILKEAIDTTCDIPVNVQETVEEFKGKFPKFDTSELEKYSDPLHFFLEDINLDFSKKILSSKILDSNDPLCSNAYDLLLDEINENYPAQIETRKSAITRVNKAKKVVKDFLESTELDSDSKVVLVGHSNYFKMWTGKWDRDISSYGDQLPEPSDSVFLRNCQFLPDNSDFPRSSTTCI